MSKSELNNTEKANSPRIKLTMKDPSHWEVYKDAAKRDVIFAHFAYGEQRHTPEELQNFADQIPKNFQMILCSDFLDDTKAHMYRAAVFVNHETKEVIFANAGTRLGLHNEGRHDLYNDAFIAMEASPPKLESAKILNQMVLDSLGHSTKDYKFHYTGHSLGAALADMAAADMALRCRANEIDLNSRGEKKISTMTFENPGAQKVIRKMYRSYGLNEDEYSNDVDYKGINNKRNFINQATLHAGQMWEIVPEGQNNDLNPAQLFILYLSFRLQKIFPIISRIVEILASGSISNQLQAHALEAFDNVLCHELGGEIRDATPVIRENSYLIEVLTNCKKVMFDEGIFTALKGKKEERGDIGNQKYVMSNSQGEIHTASITELTSVVGEKLKPAKASFIERVNPASLSSKNMAKNDSLPPVPTVIEVLNRDKGVSI